MANNKDQKDELKELIIKRMTVDYSDALEKNFELAEKIIRITPEGKVDLLYKEDLEGIDCIKLYLIGKIYAYRAGLSQTDLTGNQELIDQLGFPKGSVNSWVKKLRDAKIITTQKEGNTSSHRILLNYVEKTLKGLKRKSPKGGE